MKKFLVCILAVVMLITTLSGCGEQSRSNNWQDNDNYGESNIQNDSQKKEVVKISSGYDLRNIESDPDGSYILTNDIDLSQNSNWSPLCSSDRPFTGTLDGNGYCIKNINVDVKYAKSIDDSEYAGLFCCVSGATIKNLGIVGGTISISSATYDGMAGALAGSSSVKVDGENITLTEISNCWINATVESNLIENGTTSYGATMAVGSFFGSGCANFTNCYNLGKVAAASSYADQTIGGFIGAPRTYEQCPMTIKSCYNLGLMSGRYISGDKPGAFIGYALMDQYVDIIDSYYGTNANEYNTLRIAMTDNKDNIFTSVKGLNVEELKVQSNFSGFDFNSTWSISADKNGGYPYLKIQKAVD